MKLRKSEVTIEKLFHGATTVGERGQVVIPARARRELGIEAGDKLLVFEHPFGGLVLVKTEELRTMVGHWLGKWSAIEEMLAKEGEKDEA